MTEKTKRIAEDVNRQFAEMRNCDHKWELYVHPVVKEKMWKCNKCRAVKVYTEEGERNEL